MSVEGGREGGPRTVLRSPLPLQQATFFFPPSEVTAKSKCRRLCQIFQVVASAAAACIPSAATLGIVEEGEGREAVAAAAALA